LVGNSLKFTKESEIDVNVCSLGQEDTEIAVVQFVIRDSGVGMTKEAMKPLLSHSAKLITQRQEYMEVLDSSLSSVNSWLSSWAAT
jgi:hypothetical protein